MRRSSRFACRMIAQAAVDATAQVIVAHGLDAKQSDQHQLAPMADAIHANLDKKPAQLSADAGYCSDANLAAMEEPGINPYIAPGRAKHAADREGGGDASPPCARRSRPAATPALSPAQAIARAGVRPDQANARLSASSSCAASRRPPPMGPRLPRPQYVEVGPGAIPSPAPSQLDEPSPTPNQQPRMVRKSSAHASNPRSPALSRQAPRQAYAPTRAGKSTISLSSTCRGAAVPAAGVLNAAWDRTPISMSVSTKAPVQSGLPPFGVAGRLAANASAKVLAVANHRLLARR